MSTFSVPVIHIDAIEAHPNADAIEIAVVGEYRCVVQKGQFRAGDLVAYIPEQAVVPEWVLRDMGLWDEQKNKGRLNGRRGDRVKAVRLRGELSQGLLYPVGYGRTPGAEPGDDLADLLGITKYEPPVPVHLQGEVYNAGVGRTIAFDVESWKKYPNILADGEPVVYTEKLHGTFCGLSIMPESHPDGFGENGRITVFSKGLGAKGLAYKNNETNRNNLYVRATEVVRRHIESGFRPPDATALFVLGEITGKGVQDLAYEGDIKFRAFAVVERDGSGRTRFFDWQQEACLFCKLNGIETVPVLDRGDFSAERLRELAGGTSTLGGCIREGVVVVPERERTCPEIGRVALKYVSAAYLTRKGGTEFN